MSSLSVFRSILILLAFFITIGLCDDKKTNIISKWGENTIGRDEATCRFKLKDQAGMLWEYYVILAAISTLSIVFLGLSVGLFVYIQRYLMREMDEAVYKITHDLMDAVMVSLIPNSLLDEIGAKENKKDK